MVSTPAMPRKPRIESGGLYHVITRGNNRRKIFRSHDDYLRFTSTLEEQKARLPFYLYAYCLMPNHVHLLIEMQDDPVSRIMQRVLTSYSQYHTESTRRLAISLKVAISRFCVRPIAISASLCDTST